MENAPWWIGVLVVPSVAGAGWFVRWLLEQQRAVTDRFITHLEKLSSDSNARQEKSAEFMSEMTRVLASLHTIEEREQPILDELKRVQAEEREAREKFMNEQRQSWNR